MAIRWYGPKVEQKVNQGIRRNLDRAALLVQRAARRNVSPGGPSGFKTSHGGSGLRGSITHERTTDWTRRVGSNLRYARIHELGGHIKPRSAKYLHFVVDGHHVMTKHVYIPPRPYLRPAIDNNRAAIQRELGRPVKG